MNQMTIGEVARVVGIRSSAIRYYESMGLIACPSRVGGKRRYSMDAITTLKMIQLAKDTGFTIQEIRQIAKEQSKGGKSQWKPFATRKLEELETRMQNINSMKQLLLAALNCHCEGPRDCSVTQKRTRSK